MSPQPPGPPPGKGCGSRGAGPEPRAAARGLEEEPPLSAVRTRAPFFPTRPGSRIGCPGRSGSLGGFLIPSFWAVSPAGPIPLPRRPSGPAPPSPCQPRMGRAPNW